MNMDEEEDPLFDTYDMEDAPHIEGEFGHTVYQDGVVVFPESIPERFVRIGVAIGGYMAQCVAVLFKDNSYAGFVDDEVVRLLVSYQGDDE